MSDNGIANQEFTINICNNVQIEIKYDCNKQGWEKRDGEGIFKLRNDGCLFLYFLDNKFFIFINAIEFGARIYTIPVGFVDDSQIFFAEFQ